MMWWNFSTDADPGARSAGRIHQDGQDDVKVLQVAGPYLPVPPDGYGGSERVVDTLARELPALGIDLTTFTVGTSRTAGRIDYFFPREQAAADEAGVIARWDDADVNIQAGKAFARAHEYDFVHNHLSRGVIFSEACRTPMLTTLHSYAATGSTSDRIFASFPESNYVAISESQRRLAGHLNVIDTVPNPIPAEIWAAPPQVTDKGDYLLFLGRLSPLKGAETAIDLARRAGLPIVVAGAVFGSDRDYFDAVIRPRLASPGVEYVDNAAGPAKIALVSNARATIVPSRWNEPFGLSAIESMALGTPAVVALRGALPELVEDGVTGLVVENFEEEPAVLDRIDGLDRAVVAERSRRRFAPARAARAYVELYRRFQEDPQSAPPVRRF